ncbi:hypothetical protein [Novosphingobium sp. MMS21-SN21R]|uniref:hypothetical protein n=1 Tax=Novosphingobium sp. MMS21-SN21R TaxID=2969298 RepID=UPI002887CA93|nr:hypothetical protein [Novosphingobium sp. MMS21-SN21R]MDT0508128.1 hypothetical protein [Novosphingobium sp. MMS21-SN21R]
MNAFMCSFFRRENVVRHSAAKEPVIRQDAWRHWPGNQATNVAWPCVKFQPEPTIPEDFSPNLGPIDSLFRHTYAIIEQWRAVLRDRVQTAVSGGQREAIA